MFGMQVPAFMLKQFYQAGSLRNAEHGLQFALTNPLMPATIVEILEVAIAGKVHDLTSIAFSQDGAQREAPSVSHEAPVAFKKGAVVTVTILGESLEPGTHAVSFKVKTGEFGSLQVDVEDTIPLP
jgi:hypothetical protein